jgi:hypothetical protein
MSRPELSGRQDSRPVRIELVKTSGGRPPASFTERVTAGVTAVPTSSGGVAMFMSRSDGPARQPVAGPMISSAVGFFVAVIGMLPASLAIWWSGEHMAGLAVLTVVVGAYAAAMRNTTGALITAAVSWMLFNGFVVHSLGDLAWEGANDAVRLAVLTGAAVTGTLIGRVLAGNRADLMTAEKIPAPRTPARSSERPEATARRAERKINSSEIVPPPAVLPSHR